MQLIGAFVAGILTASAVLWLLRIRRSEAAASREPAGEAGGASDSIANAPEPLHEGLIVQEADGSMVSCNEAAARILDVSETELAAGRPWSALFEWVDENGERLERFDLGGDESGEEHVRGLRREGGSVQWLRVQVRSLNDAAGRAAGRAAISFCDITRVRKREEALRRSEERFRVAFDRSPIGMALVSLDGRFLLVNPALTDLVGYSEDELLAMKLREITHPEDWERGEAILRRLVARKTGSLQVQKRYVHQTGRVVWVLFTVTVVTGDDGEPEFIICQIQDLTERREFEAKLVHLAMRDPLTDLLNRGRFEEEVERELARAVAYGTEGAVLCLDLDHFMYINESLGHRAGDEVIKHVSMILADRLQETDVLARLSGDEFGILLPNSDRARAERIASDILTHLEGNTLQINGHSVGVTGSVGIALFPEHGRSAETLLANSDSAMSQMKERGRNGYHVYDPETDTRWRVKSKLNWEARIRRALEEEQFALYAQPILDLASNTVSQYELLLRMVTPEGQVIEPGGFLGVAERFGLITAIDRWVIREAIRLISAQKQAGRDLRLEVNLSGRALVDGQLLPMIEEELAASSIDPALLILEITETVAIGDRRSALRFVERLTEMGCRFAIDDFGVGFSSFYYLKYWPVTYLKIDGSFIRDLPCDPVDQHLVKAAVEVAKGLGKKTIAEYVGNRETLELLAEYGVDYVQGYHIGRPRPVDDIFSDSAAEKDEVWDFGPRD